MRSHALLLSVLPVLAAGLPAQRPIEDVFPASSYGVVRFAGLDALREASSELGMARLGEQLLGQVEEEAYERYVGRSVQRAARMLRQELDDVGLTPRQLRTVLSRPIAVAIGRATFFGPALVPSVTLAAEAGEDQEAWQRVLERVESRLLGELPRGTVAASTEMGGHGFRSLTHDHYSGRLLLGIADGVVLISNSEGHLAECLEVMAGQSADLASTSTLGELRGELPGPALLSGYMHVAPFMGVIEAYEPLLPYGLEEIPEVLGVSGFEGIYAATARDDEGSVEVVHFGVSGSEDGVLRAPFAEGVSFDAAAYCAPQTVMFGAAAVDVPAFLAAAERFAGLLPMQARMQMERGLERELRRSGTSPEEIRKLIDALGSTAAFAVELREAVPMPDVLAFVEVHDRTVIEPHLQAIEEESGLEWKTRKLRDAGIEVRYSRFDVNRGRGTVPVVVAPSYAFHGDHLILSSQTQALVRAVRRAEEDREAFGDAEDFAVLTEDCANATALVHFRYDRAVHMGWRLAEPFLINVLDERGREYGVDGGIVPAPEELAGAFGTATVSLHVDGDGITLRQRSNTGFGSLMSIAGAVADHVLAEAGEKVY